MTMSFVQCSCEGGAAKSTSSSGSPTTSREPSSSPLQSPVSTATDECASEHVDDMNDSVKDIAREETIPNDPDRVFSIFTQDFQDLPRLSSEIISAPARYVDSTPGKKIRDKAAGALNLWLQVDEQDLNQIRHVINMLHNASLILDDVEDGSVSRRGRPAAHMIFGIPQAINSAGYQINQAIMEALKLGSTPCLEIFIEELDRMYIGQGYDLFWTFNTQRPSVEKYISMVDYKTGSLFNMLARLMAAKSQANTPDLSRLVVLLGRYFQIRDDYMNLTSEEYTLQKGFCDDLDEGKYSLTLVHALENSAQAEHSILSHVLTQRHVANGMSLAQKHLVVDIVKGAGSLQFTVAALREMGREIDDEIDRIEGVTGVENGAMRGLVDVLRV